MKKFTAIVICAIMFFCLLPAATFAEEIAYDPHDVFDVDEVDNYATFIDSFYWNGERLNYNSDWLAREAMDDYMDDKATLNAEDRDTCGFLGWVCFYEPVKTFGYLLNDKLYTSDDFFWPDNTALASVVEGWWPGSGELVRQYIITVPIRDLYGTTEIVAVAVLETGEIVKLNSEIDPTRDTTVVFEFAPDPNATPTPEPEPATAVPEEPTEAPEEPTKAPDAEPVAVATEEPASDPADKPADAETKKGGCGGMISGAAVLAAAAAAFFAVRKKK